MTFTVSPGQVTGFIGPNGAGKSTTMRVILGLDAPDAGHALIGGRPYRSLRRPLTQVGALLDAAALQPSRTARNHLLWLAHSQGLGARRVDEVIAQAGLGKAARRKAGGYSLGMRQRLGIAAALLGDPPALMLDEPFNGMDPEGIVWMRGFLAALAAEGRAVLVSSHLMSELQDTAGHLVIVGRGTVIADTSPSRTCSRRCPGTGSRCGPAPAGTRRPCCRTRGRRWPITGGGILTVSGLPAERIVALLGDSTVPFSEVIGAPGDAGGGLHGAHQGRRGVPRPSPPGRPRDDRRHADALPAGHRRPGPDSFAHLLHAEWTKFRTVRGWVIAVIVAALVTVAARPVHRGPQPETGCARTARAITRIPTGPGGEAVTDTYYFVHRPLAADGSITVRK